MASRAPAHRSDQAGEPPRIHHAHPTRAARLVRPARRGRRAQLASVARLLTLALLAGCYKFVPVAGGTPARAIVRVRLNEQGATTLGKRLGVAPATLEGEVLDATRDSLVIRMTASTSAFTAQRVTWVGERVAIPADAVASTERRTLDKRRTMVVAASAVAGSIVVFLGVRNMRGVAGGDGTPGGGGGTPP